MSTRRTILVFAYCLVLFIVTGCTMPGGQWPRIQDSPAQYEGDTVADALAQLTLAVDQLPGTSSRQEAAHSLQRLAGILGQNWLDGTTARRYVAGESVENRPLEYIVLGDGGDVILILASIHGNEAAGTPLVDRLTDYLRQNPLILYGCKLVLVPVANPDGIAHNTRVNANGVDLNRNFGAANRLNSRKHGYAALSEPESRFIHLLINQYEPSRIVTIHQPLTCIDYDGPGRSSPS